MKVELVTRREELTALSQRWDELAREDARDGFFRTSVGICRGLTTSARTSSLL